MGPAKVPVGGGGARPRCWSAAAGPGRASRRGESSSAQQAPPVWRPPAGPENLAAVPVGGGRARARLETTRRAEGSRRGRRAGGPPPTGAPSSPAHETGHAAPGTPAAPQATKQEGKGARKTYHGAGESGEPGCGARGRWRGLAGLRGDTSTDGVEGAGESGEPGRGARGRRRGLAGLRDDAPSRRLAARTASGRAAAHGRTKQSGSNTRKPRPADAGRGSPTQSGGRV